MPVWLRWSPDRAIGPPAWARVVAPRRWVPPGAYARVVFTGMAHAAIRVDDVDAATLWYSEILGHRVLSPPYRVEGAALEWDMGELLAIRRPSLLGPVPGMS